jgi:release factor glutamine methyltransferase
VSVAISPGVRFGRIANVSVAGSAHDAVVQRLRAAGCVDAGAEAELFVASAADPLTLEAWVSRRERGEPPAWITGRVRFCGQALHITPGVYVPRSQSEELARRAAMLLPDHGRALDLCTGIGAVAAHLKAAVPTAAVFGADVDARAAECAARNGVTAVVADVAEPFRSRGDFDVVTAIAPYVPTDEMRLLPADVQRYESRVALDGGADGLDLVRRIIVAGSRLLRPAGWLLVEVGADQDERLARTFAENGLGGVTPWRDDDGDLRGIAAQLTSSPS